MRAIGTNVHVTDPETGVTTVLQPGTMEEEIPENLLGQLTNPKVWIQNDPHEAYTEDPDEVFDTGQDYSNMTVPQLVKEVKTRGVTAESTRKADLIAALQRDDAQG